MTGPVWVAKMKRLLFAFFRRVFFLFRADFTEFVAVFQRFFFGRKNFGAPFAVVVAAVRFVACLRVGIAVDLGSKHNRK